MKRCPVCNVEYEDPRVFCTQDGSVLRSSSGADTLVGRVLDGKYMIEEPLGRGGMGAVYRARHLLIGDDVAIKILRPEMAASEDAIERLRREAKAARHLRNPHTISVIDFSATEDGLVYLVMEFVRGSSLRELLKLEPKLGFAFAADIASQVAEGLDHAHRQGVVHRDLKPDNIMLEDVEGGRVFVRVLDFGIAKLSDSETRLRTLTNEDTILGTPCYLSPEQCGSGEVGPRSDVYSLGILVYEMLTGDVPFDGGSALEVARKHLMAEPPSPRSLRPDLTAQAEAVILKALSKAPDDRYESAGEFAKAFRPAVNADDEELASTANAPMRALKASRATTSYMLRKTGEEGDPPTNPTGETVIAVGPPAAGSSAMMKRALIGLVVLALVGLAAWWIVQSGVWPAPARSSAPPTTEMILIPAGPFVMGSDTTRQDCQDEHPMQTRELNAFLIDRTEVTNAQYRAFCDATGRTYPANPGWNGDYFLSKPEYPVINVTWKDAGDYAKWAGKRLPTEAEWEKAARGTDGWTYPWGNDLRSDATTIAGNADGFENTAPVGSFPAGASPYGALDMIGNVFEWTEDWYQAYPGSDGSWDKLGDTGFKKRVVRGGSFTMRPEIVGAAGGIARTSERFCEAPDYKTVNLGFRCAKTP